MKLLAIEGNTQRLDGGAMFGNVPKELWKQWIIPDELNRIHLACRTLLLQTDSGRNILFETGIGTFFDPKMRERFGVEKEHLLLQNLALHGIQETDIDTIVLSHLHFDHAGGLLSPYDEGEPQLLFPNAKIYLGKEHWERARNPHLRERMSFIPLLNKLLEASPRLILIDGESHPDLPHVKFYYSNGHTMGLMLAELELPKGKLIFISDLVPGIPWVHLPIVMGYDRFPERTVEEKKSLFEKMTLEKGTALFFSHDIDTPCVKLSQSPQGKYQAEAIPLHSLI